MRPRLTGGVLRGRPLPESVAEGVRPTSARVREALFSIVGHDLRGVRVLDAFGGSGLLGLEAWSRGADVVVVEHHRGRAAAIRRAAGVLTGDDNARFRVEVGDVTRAGGERGVFDGVLADPPYADAPAPILASLGPVATQWLMLEQPSDRVLPPSAGALEHSRSRRYGGTTLHLYTARLVDWA
ncbi:MAG: 16S rRNA (guanine966-N2)-methyltransferase [Myxococcota bacterium]